MSKQDRQGVRTPADVERKYNFGQSFSEVFSIANDARTAASDAMDAVNQLDASMDHDTIFNLLTKNGELEGIYRGEDGEIYINATYINTGEFLADLIKAGVIRSKDGESVVIDLDKGEAKLVGTIESHGEILDDGSSFFTSLHSNGLRMWNNNKWSTDPYYSDGWITGDDLRLNGALGRISAECRQLHNDGTSTEYTFLQFRNDIGGVFSSDKKELSLCLGENRAFLTGLTAPVDASDATNKEYVDSLSTKNLLDNSDFRNPINQREKTEYSGGGYTIDRWCFANSNGILTICDGCISLSSGVGYWKQIVEMTPSELGTYTMSLLTYQGELYVARGNPNNAAGVTLDNGCYFYYETTSDGLVSVNVRIAASARLDIKAIKLERGTSQTLARKDSDGSWVLVDSLPNRQQELAKCQRYFIRLTKPNNPYSSFVGMGTASSDSHCFCLCPVPVTMRDIPNVSASSCELLNNGIGVFSSISSVSVYGAYANNQVTLTAASSGLVKGDLYYLVCRRNNGYIDLSADL